MSMETKELTMSEAIKLMESAANVTKAEEQRKYLSLVRELKLCKDLALAREELNLQIENRLK